MKTIRLWLFWLVALSALSLCACGGGSPVVAQVGETAITAQDVAYRQAVVVVRSGEDFPAHLALFQLVDEALMAEVGRAYGVVITAEMLAEEAARVEAESRDPETLARMRTVFGDDQAAYRRLVLAPILVNQMLHARFSLGHDIQAEPLARAQEALAAALDDPESLAALAKAFGGEYRRFEIVAGRLQTGEQQAGESLPEALAQYEVALPETDQAFVEQVVAGLAVGELHLRVVEDRHSFMVVRLLSRDGEDATLEGLVIPKLTFVPWFQTHSRRISLVVTDQALKEALLTQVDAPYITGRLAAER